MADEDISFVSSSSVETITKLMCGELPGIARLAEKSEVDEVISRETNVEEQTEKTNED